jgi:ABC-type lipoprotein release transport system permease subunit
METPNNLLDKGNLWIDLGMLQEMTGLPNAATYVILEQDFPVEQVPLTDWQYKSVYDLSADVRAFVAAKSSGSVFMYVFLMAMAMLAIFDTQVLSIWRRKREMGTLLAMGMTRGKLIQLFTLEGSLHGVLAGVAALIWGGPLLYWQANVGFRIPYDEDMIGFLMPEVIIPAYTLGLIVATTLITLVAVTIVSWLPVRKLAQLKPTDALRGKLS